MTEPIRLKSRLLRAGDPWQVDISQFQIPLTADQGLYERDLLNFRRRFAVVEEAGEIAPQDMATLTCTSANPRFCKEHVTIRVGLGLFSKELEGKILGWKPGETGTVTVRDQPVTVTVEGIRRESLPEVDDALAARCGIPGIRTAEDIHVYCKGKQFDKVLEEPLDEAFAYLSREVIEASAFALDAEELEFCQKQILQEFDRRSLFEGKGVDSMPEEAFQESFGCSKEELLENMRSVGIYTLQSALLGQTMLERDGKLATMADYEAYLRRYLDNGRPEAQVRQEHPVLEYAVNFYCDFFMDALEALTLRRLKENVL